MLYDSVACTLLIHLIDPYQFSILFAYDCQDLSFSSLAPTPPIFSFLMIPLDDVVWPLLDNFQASLI